MAGVEGIPALGRALHARSVQEHLGHAVAGGEAVEGDAPTFAETLEQALGEVTELQETADNAIGAFLSGEPVEIHEVMAAAEEAGIALEMVIEIRNKLTEAYRTVSQMQQ